MAFRKRNIVIGQPSGSGSTESRVGESTLPAIRPSPLTSHPVTSTGTPSLDGLLGGHGGLALGTSLLIEESGNTDFSGVLLKCFAAEGLCQGHVLHLVGPGEGWIRELPGVAEEKNQGNASHKIDEEKMKIAWRYGRQTLTGERGASILQYSSLADVIPQFHVVTVSRIFPFAADAPFCHVFDLTKRLAITPSARVNHIPVLASSTFESIIQGLSKTLENSPRGTVHRLAIPSLLNPALYPSQASQPEAILNFLHGLRSLLRQHSGILAVMMNIPLELYPRSTGLVRWAEILSDGVIELTPFPHLMDSSHDSVRNSGSGTKEHDEQPQGLVRVHRLPINTERGEGGAGAGNSIGEDLAFTVSRRNFRINPFSLPPVEGDQEAQQEAGKLTGKNIDF